jgi:decaprenylphosphoryl-5-phosphoribose phosphatase
VSNPTSTASGSEPVGGGTLHQSWRARANALDLDLYRRVRSLARTPEHVRDVRNFSRLGEHGAVWLAMGACGVAVDGGNRSRWARAAASVAVSYACSTSIKLLVGRKRPAVEDLPHLMATPTGLSFPSSHASSSFAAARAYGGLLPSSPLYAAAVAMALSRVYLGVHYPSDIAAGAGVGTAIGSLGR